MSLRHEIKVLAESVRYTWALITGGAYSSDPRSESSAVVRPHPAHRTVLRLAAFLGVIIAAAFLLQEVINTGLHRVTTSDFGIANQIASGTGNAELLISGSSRALTHYDTRVLSRETGARTLNIGRNGSQTDLQLAILKTYLKHNAKPTLVVHNLDPYSLVTSHEIYDVAHYLPYLHEEAIYSAVTRVYPQAWKWKYLPLYGYLVEDLRFTWMLGLKGYFNLQPRQDRIEGFQPRHTAWTGDFEKFRANNPKGVTIDIEDQGIRDLAELAALCRTHGIPLLFVYSPEYFEMQTLEQNRAEVFTQFQRICDRYEVPMWDYSDSLICKSREFFYNSQHLNADGAAAFSNDLAQRLAKSGLLNHPLARIVPAK